MTKFHVGIVAVLISFLSLSSCVRNCQYCTIERKLTASNPAVTGYPIESENTARYCDAQLDNVKQQEGVYTYDENNGVVQYSVTEVVRVKCE